MIYHVITDGFMDVRIYGCESCTVLADNEIHVINVVK